MSKKQKKKDSGTVYAKYGYPYNNRELSWMDFNLRVLEEAFEKENPLFERLKFLSITASNLDEFFMVRVAGIYDQIHSDYTVKDPAGLTPHMQIENLSEKIHAFSEKQYSCLSHSLIPAMKRQGFKFLTAGELSEKQQKYIKKYFSHIIFPVLTPLAVDPSRPFPLLGNKTVNIAVRLRDDNKENAFALLQVPSILPRFLELPAENEDEKEFILLENVILNYLKSIFELFTIKASCVFRITRDGDLEIDEETDDLLEEIEKSIKKRKRGKPVRLELQGSNCDEELERFLIEMLEVEERDIYRQRGPLDLTFLSKLASLEDYDEFRFKPISPVNPPAEFYGYNDIFEAIRKKDRLIHLPYESFDPVLKFVRQAAADENVLAIKQTLYRVSGNSPIVDALIKAAENGKQVTVLVELKARFDEENNIHWAKKLEKAGCHVIYGVYGLKTHCKILLVVRKENNGIRRYLHMGTGNYNDITARFYTDIGMFTCREEYGEDASSLFNVLTGYSRPPQYNRFIVAPKGMRSFFEEKIKQEIKNAQMGIKAGITVKINSLVDPEIIKLLYQASQAGVKIDLIVRGICCLIPGIQGISDNIRVYSIVGQLLEHSRIFIFENGGSRLIYLGSADWMPRNLDRRVELVFPVLDENLRARVCEITDVAMKDTVNRRMQLADSSYKLVDKRGKKRVNSQKELWQRAKKTFLAAKQKFDEEEEKELAFKNTLLNSELND